MDINENMDKRNFTQKQRSIEQDRKRIIMVDDDMTTLTAAMNALIDKYDVFTVPSGKKMFSLLEKMTPDLILLDVDMPEMNGYEVIEVLKASGWTADIPVIFLSALNDPKSEMKGLSAGAVDYIFKPFFGEILIKRIELHLLLESQKKDLQSYSDCLEKIIEKKIQTVGDMQNAFLRTMAELVECRDDTSGGHIERIHNYFKHLISLLEDEGVYEKEMSTWDMEQIIISSQLHDLGKISIKDEILLKPGKLTEAEFEEVKKHTLFGAEVIGKIGGRIRESTFLEHARIMAGSHHERWDGTGYPHGLIGTEIPLEGRLMAIVDVYDALINDRPYRKAFSHEEAIQTIKEGIGSQFDPHIGEVFLKHEKEFKKVGTET